MPVAPLTEAEPDMKLKQYVETATEGVFSALDTSPSEEQAAAVAAVIEVAVIKATLESRSACVDVAQECCSGHQDLAHKITEEMRLANNALIANLSSMR